MHEFTCQGTLLCSQYLGCVGEEAPEAGEVRVDALAAAALGLAVALGRGQSLGVHDRSG